VLKVTKHTVLPLTYVGMSANAQDREYSRDLANFRTALSEDLRAGRKTVVILDLRRSSVLSTSQRWMTGVWMKEVAPLFESTTFGTVFIVESALARGVLSALLWVQPKGTPYALVADLDSAVLWAISCMEDARVNLSIESRETLRTVLNDELGRLSRDAA
jgi:hypothetical protein